MCGEPTAPADRITSRTASAFSIPTTTRKFYAGSAFAVEQNAVDQRVCDQLKVWSLQCRVQIGPRSACASAPPTGLLAPADAIACTGRQVVDVFAILKAKLFACLDHCSADRGTIHFRREQRSVLATHRIAFALPPLGFAEEWQTVVPRPAAVSKLCPVVIILRLTTDVDQPVDRGGAANYPTAGVDDSAAIDAGIGFCAVFPGKGRVVEHLEETRRDMDERIPITTTRLDQQHFGVGVLRQPVSQHAAG